jgi:Pyruvate/2-oxoacid:ferredoxin oxidoreductase delta subunit
MYNYLDCIRLRNISSTMLVKIPFAIMLIREKNYLKECIFWPDSKKNSKKNTIQVEHVAKQNKMQVAVHIENTFCQKKLLKSVSIFWPESKKNPRENRHCVEYSVVYSFCRGCPTCFSVYFRVEVQTPTFVSWNDSSLSSLRNRREAKASTGRQTAQTMYQTVWFLPEIA